MEDKAIFNAKIFEFEDKREEANNFSKKKEFKKNLILLV